jgi:hypothetical protein
VLGALLGAALEQQLRFLVSRQDQVEDVVAEQVSIADRHLLAAVRADPEWGWLLLRLEVDYRIGRVTRHHAICVMTAHLLEPTLRSVPGDTDDGLDRLSSKELHDVAVSYAKRHRDVRFFWQLMEILPAAEAAAGETDKMEADVMEMGAHIDDLTDSGGGETAEMLRPFYLDYLRRHGIQAP